MTLWLLAILAPLLVGGAIYLWWRGTAFNARIAATIAEVKVATGTTQPDLPPIVSAYALRNGGAIGRTVAIRLEHRAKLSLDQARPPIDLHAEQWLSPTTSDMAWVGRGSMSGIPVAVIDAFTAGHGVLEARLAGAIQVAGGTGPDFDKGELQRYLSELPVHPDAILNNGTLAWQQLDAHSVEVTGQSASGPASVTITFDETGDIVALEATDRPMLVDGKAVPTVWKGRYSDYRTLGGYRIPTHGEVGWQLDDGLFIYWRGDIVAYEATHR